MLNNYIIGWIKNQRLGYKTLKNGHISKRNEMSAIEKITRLSLREIEKL